MEQPHEHGHGVTPTASLVCRSLELKIDRMEHARKRDPDGAKWCKKRGVGFRRELLGYAGPSNIIPIRDMPAETALRDARKFFAEHCRICGLCPLAKVMQG